MSFIVRPVKREDLSQLLDLAKQFNLLNLPGNKKVLTEKIERSELSFANKIEKSKAEYIFVLEDLEEKLIVGSSLILAKHGTEEIPHYFFKISKREHFSKDLGIGFIHQVLSLQKDVNGSTEIGGLLVDKSYRRRPEKLGKQISLMRFIYMGMYPEKFQEQVLCELTPPLTEEGRSEFWESLGRRFTGLPYQEADLLSQSHKEFIESLFPAEDIYLCLLDSSARLVLGRVGENTKPAQHLLESIGFKYLEEVDPFDGGPHYGATLKSIEPIRRGRKLALGEFAQPSFTESYLIGVYGEFFRGVLCPADVREGTIALPSKIVDSLGLNKGDFVFAAPLKKSTY